MRIVEFVEMEISLWNVKIKEVMEEMELIISMVDDIWRNDMMCNLYIEEFVCLNRFGL